MRRLPLTVLHCFWDAAGVSAASRIVAAGEEGVEDERLLLAESVSGMTEKFPDVSVRLELARGLADDALVRLSQQMDLVVVGYHPMRPLAGLVYGSVASTVLEHASCIVGGGARARRGGAGRGDAGHRGDHGPGHGDGRGAQRTRRAGVTRRAPRW